MKSSFSSLRAASVALLVLAPVGCASRAVPFDSLDRAQVTIYRIQAPQPVAPIPGATGGANPLGPLLSQLGIPPEQQQQWNDMMKQWQQMGIPGLPPLPGMTPPPPGGMNPQQPLFRGQWQIVGQAPVMDEKKREELLDLFGSADSFTGQPAQCWTPGMAVSFQDPSRPEPVDVIVSLDCNAANGFGFVWPHQGKYGLAPKTNQTLGQLYQQMFQMPVPPQGA